MRSKLEWNLNIPNIARNLLAGVSTFLFVFHLLRTTQVRAISDASQLSITINLSFTVDRTIIAPAEPAEHTHTYRKKNRTHTAPCEAHSTGEDWAAAAAAAARTMYVHVYVCYIQAQYMCQCAV